MNTYRLKTEETVDDQMEQNKKEEKRVSLSQHESISSPPNNE